MPNRFRVLGCFIERTGEASSVSGSLSESESESESNPLIDQNSQLALGPADRLDGRTLDVELLITEWQMAFSLSIPIPIATPTPTPIALRRCLDSVV
jgi:hypothetical protein